MFVNYNYVILQIMKKTAVINNNDLFTQKCQDIMYAHNKYQQTSPKLINVSLKIMKPYPFDSRAPRFLIKVFGYLYVVSI